MNTKKVVTTKTMNMASIMRRRKAPKVQNNSQNLVKIAKLNSREKISNAFFFIDIGWIAGKKGHKKFHKKGSKATGYHKKANKDDYHKEHKFYDSEEKKGDHKKYGSEHEYHEAEKGEHGKGDKHESGYDEGHKGNCLHSYFICLKNICSYRVSTVIRFGILIGKKGHHKKGHYDDDHKGYHGKHGHDKKYEHHEGHSKKGGKKGGHEKGYQSKKGGH